MRSDLDQFLISVSSTTKATFIAPSFAVVTVGQKSMSSLQMNSYNHMPEKTALSQKNNLHIRRTLQPLSRYLKWSTNGNGQMIKG